MKTIISSVLIAIASTSFILVMTQTALQSFKLTHTGDIQYCGAFGPYQVPNPSATQTKNCTWADVNGTDATNASPDLIASLSNDQLGGLVATFQPLENLPGNASATDKTRQDNRRQFCQNLAENHDYTTNNTGIQDDPKRATFGQFLYQCRDASDATSLTASMFVLLSFLSVSLVTIF